MSSQFGFIDIILLAMFAGFIILRLRNILGRKTGHQGKPISRYFPKGMEGFGPQTVIYIGILVQYGAQLNTFF